MDPRLAINHRRDNHTRMARVSLESAIPSLSDVPYLNTNSLVVVVVFAVWLYPSVIFLAGRSSLSPVRYSLNTPAGAARTSPFGRPVAQRFTAVSHSGSHT